MWFTALCIAFLRGGLSALATDWLLVERKAAKWLGRRWNTLSAPDLPCLLAAAQAALGL